MFGRERTAASKQNVDAFNLQLQNLRYEVLHLRKEVSRCINFRSADENIRLVPVEEFYREADPDISQPDTTQGDESLMEIISSVTDRVVDPYSFFTDPDPDPEFDVGDQYGSGSGSSPIRIQGFNDQKFQKNYSLKFFLNFFYIKNCNLPIPRPP